MHVREIRARREGLAIPVHWVPIRIVPVQSVFNLELPELFSRRA